MHSTLFNRSFFIGSHFGNREIHFLFVLKFGMLHLPSYSTRHDPHKPLALRPAKGGQLCRESPLVTPNRTEKEEREAGSNEDEEAKRIAEKPEKIDHDRNPTRVLTLGFESPERRGNLGVRQ
jgi:hypothetical protein